MGQVVSTHVCFGMLQDCLSRRSHAENLSEAGTSRPKDADVLVPAFHGEFTGLLKVGEAPDPQHPSQQPAAKLYTIPAKCSVYGKPPGIPPYATNPTLPESFLSPQQAETALEIAKRGLPHDILTFGAPAAPNMEEHHEVMEAMGLKTAPKTPEIGALMATMCSILGAPLSAITLIEGCQIWVEYGHGCENQPVPWCNSHCPWTLLSKHPTALVVEDMAQDARYSHEMWIPRGILSYIGTPLVASNGHRIGTLCFLDVKVRVITAAQVAVVNSFSELVVRELERQVQLRYRMAEHELCRKLFAKLQRQLAAQERCVLVVDTSQQGWKVLWASTTWEHLTSGALPRDELLQAPLRACFGPPPGSRPQDDLWTGLEAAIAGGSSFMVQQARLLAAGASSGTNLAKGSASARAAGLASEASSLPGASTASDMDGMSMPGAPASSTSNVSSGSSMAAGRSLSQLYNLSFRPMSAGSVDELALVINTPSSVSLQPELQSYYFMTVQRAQRGAQARWLSEQRAQHISEVQGLQVDRLLGRGAFGAVYHGQWKGKEVAVKMLQDIPDTEEEVDTVATEIAVALQVEHPNVLRTYAFTMTRCEDGISRPYSPRAAAAGEGAAAASAAFPGGAAGMERAGSGSVASNAVVPSSSNGGSPGAFVVLQWDGSSRVTSGSGSPRAGPGGAKASGTTSSSSSNSAGVASNAVVPSGPSGSAISSHRLAASSSARSLLAAGASGVATVSWPDSSTISSATGFSAVTNLTMGSLVVDSHASMPDNASDDGVGATVSAVVVMEYADKGCLQSAIDSGWFLTTRCLGTGHTNMEALLATAGEVAQGLAALHAQGVVHGDLSAYNVVLSSRSLAANRGGRGFVAKVADFGLSRKLDYTTMLRINSYGSVTHMPPELLTSGLLSRAADVYSLGVLMWQMYCCSRPWAGMRHVAIVHAVVHEGKRLTFPEGTPEAFASLASRCMASEPQARPTCEQVVEEVEAMMRVLVPVELEGEF